MASGRNFKIWTSVAALGSGLGTAGALMLLGKVRAPPVITSAMFGGAGLIGIGLTRGPVQAAIASGVGACSAIFLGGTYMKTTVRAEKKDREERIARGEVPTPVKNKKVRDNEIAEATVAAFDRLRAELAIDEEERAAA